MIIGLPIHSFTMKGMEFEKKKIIRKIIRTLEVLNDRHNRWGKEKIMGRSEKVEATGLPLSLKPSKIIEFLIILVLFNIIRKISLKIFKNS